jgi:hypothetical protein
MVYVTKPDGSSYMHVYDAATMDATPVAEVRRHAEQAYCALLGLLDGWQGSCAAAAMFECHCLFMLYYSPR